MNQKITISYKTKNILIDELIKQENIQVVKKVSLFKTLFSKKKYADIYFHSGLLDEKSILNINNAKITIVNSFGLKNEIIDKLNISSEKIMVIYPSIDLEYKESEEIKLKIFEELKIDLNNKIIFFTAKNFKSSGVKEFLDFCSNINYEDFKIIIAGEQKQIYALKFQLQKYKKLEDKLILLENYKNVDELFWASDIFILPTYNKSFSTNIIKAMFCKCAVFLCIENDAKEIIDVFASMSSPADPSMMFKIDAILDGNDDLKLIKEQNHKLAQEFTLSNNLIKINDIIKNV